MNKLVPALGSLVALYKYKYYDYETPNITPKSMGGDLALSLGDGEISE